MHVLSGTGMSKNRFLGKTDRSQALARVLVVVIGVIYIHSVCLYGESKSISENYIPLFIAYFYLIISYSWFLFIKNKSLEEHHSLRTTVLALDICIISYMLASLGVDGIGLYAFYLWVIVGSGYRFGIVYLKRTALLSIVGLIISSLWWDEKDYSILSVIGLSIGMFMVAAMYGAILIELSDANDKLYWQSHHDSLTKLPNREQLRSCLRSINKVESSYTILALDLDGFKQVNDTLGHDKGDELLIHVAKRLLHVCRQDDLIARIGGDEFIIVMNNLVNVDSISHVADRIIDIISDPYHLNEVVNDITVSIGIASSVHDGTDPDILLKYADIALYDAKNRGKNQYVFHSFNDKCA
jgi:diguanylate cyclase (GGDEF)-like protein